jgi:hypothetical protein
VAVAGAAVVAVEVVAMEVVATAEAMVVVVTVARSLAAHFSSPGRSTCHTPVGSPSAIHHHLTTTPPHHDTVPGLQGIWHAHGVHVDVQHWKGFTSLAGPL